MAFMRIHCGVCGRVWEVYNHGNWKADSARTCPGCFAEVDKTHWEQNILPVFGEMNDAERDMMKSEPIFSVDIISDRAKAERNKGRGMLCPVLENNMLDYDIPYQF